LLCADQNAEACAVIVRLGLNFGAHLLAGVAFGALAACAAKSCLRKDRAAEHEHHHDDDAPEPDVGAKPESA